MEILLEHEQSKRVVKCSADQSIVKVISKALGLSENAVGFAEHLSDASSLILQRYCSKWDTFVDVNNEKEVVNGDRLQVVSIPKAVIAKEGITKVKSICSGLAKPSEANAKALSNLFPATKKRKFDILSPPANASSAQKKKAFPNKQGRSKSVKVVLLRKNDGTVPRGVIREELRKCGQIKDVPFVRHLSVDEVKLLIKQSFSLDTSTSFQFLKANKDNSVSLAEKQELTGMDAINLAGHGCLYVEALEPAASSTAPSPPPQHAVYSVATPQPAPQPAIVTPQPSVIIPQPATVTPQPAAVTPQPAVVTPQPAAVTPQPAIVTPQPAIVTPQPAVVTPQPAIVTPQPAVITPQSEVIARADRVLAELNATRSSFIHEGFSLDDYVDSPQEVQHVVEVKESMEDFREIRRQQDMLYEESLRIDREKEFVKQKDAEIQEKIVLLQAELKAKFKEYSSSSGNSFEVCFKLPDGSRNSFSFKEDATIKDLYQFVAQDISLPFLLSSHTQTVFPVIEDVLCDSADIYRSQVIFVIVGEGDRMKQLQLLSDSVVGQSSVLCDGRARDCSDLGFKLQRELERLKYMKEVNATNGAVRIIDRDNVYEDVRDMYTIGEIVGECPISIQFSGEMALDYGGVQRDMLSEFWEQAYSKHFEGARMLIPLVHPHMDMSIYPILGRIISHGYLVAGHLPIRIALPTLINMLLGPKKLTSQILLDAFLDYISIDEKTVFKEALGNSTFSPDVKQALLGVLSRFNCRQLPTPDNLVSSICRIAEYEFVARPAAAIFAVHAGIPLNHQAFWAQQSVNSMSDIYYSLAITNKKVIDLLLLDPISQNEERIGGYLTAMIGNMDFVQLRTFLRFVTGSSVCVVSKIEVVFVPSTGLSMLPTAHTCGPTLVLSSTYVNYDQFHQDWATVLDKINREYTFPMVIA